MYFLGFEILEKWIARNGGGGQTLNWSAGASPYFCVQRKPHVPTMAWRSPLKAYVTSWGLWGQPALSSPILNTTPQLKPVSVEFSLSVKSRKISSFNCFDSDPMSVSAEFGKEKKYQHNLIQFLTIVHEAYWHQLQHQQRHWHQNQHRKWCLQNWLSPWEVFWLCIDCSNESYHIVPHCPHERSH